MKIRFEEYSTVKQDIDSRNVGKHRSRDVRNVKKEKCLDQISTRDYHVNGRCMAIWSIGWTCFDVFLKRVVSSEKKYRNGKLGCVYK